MHLNVWTFLRAVQEEEHNNRMNAASSDLGFALKKKTKYDKVNQAIKVLYTRLEGGLISENEFVTKISIHIASLKL